MQVKIALRGANPEVECSEDTTSLCSNAGVVTWVKSHCRRRRVRLVYQQAVCALSQPLRADQRYVDQTTYHLHQLGVTAAPHRRRHGNQQAVT